MNKRIYVIRSQEFIKIGLATDIKERLSQLQVGNPYRLSLEALSAPTAVYADLEKILHRAHGGKHIGGEWFHLDHDEAEGLKSLVLDRFEELERLPTWSADPVSDYLALREQSLVVPPADQEA